jgi:DnaJ-class molecular chaperone
VAVAGHATGQAREKGSVLLSRSDLTCPTCDGTGYAHTRGAAPPIGFCDSCRGSGLADPAAEKEPGEAQSATQPHANIKGPSAVLSGHSDDLTLGIEGRNPSWLSPRDP